MGDALFLFDSAHAALVFAFNASSQCYERPFINRMAAPAAGGGKGLAGLDGAAQAGMIRQELQALGKLPEAILIARAAPRSLPCSCRRACCSGRSTNKEWDNAIMFLADQSRTTALGGCVSNGVMRREYVMRYFSQKDNRQDIDKLCEQFGFDRRTVDAHAKKVAHWLRGSKDGTPGLETLAENAIEDRLREIGIVE